MWALYTLLQALLATRVLAESHYLFVSSYSSPHLYSLKFDDETQQLTQAGHIVGHDGHPWISFSYDKSALYAGERDGFASYAVDNATQLSYKRSVTLQGQCGQKIENFGTTYILPLTRAPFTVIGAPFGNCMNAMSVDADGTLQDVVQNITLESSSGIHGMAVDPENDIVYSADDSANGIWVHEIEEGSQNLKQLAFVKAPEENAGPRHLTVHPNGRYLYVIMEARNEIAVYAVNSGAGSENLKIAFTGLRYSLIPKGANPSDYKADEVLLSADSNILYASTRYKGPGGENHSAATNNTAKAQASGPGYVTAVLLVPISEKQNPVDGHNQGPGFPLRQLFQVKTTTSGGASNAVSPAPWDRDYFAISDTEIGQVEIWKVEGGTTDNAYYAGATGQDALTPAEGGWQNGVWISAPKAAPTPAAAPSPVSTASPSAVPVASPPPYGFGGNPFQQGGGYGPPGGGWQGSVPNGPPGGWQGSVPNGPPGGWQGSVPNGPPGGWQGSVPNGPSNGGGWQGSTPYSPKGGGNPFQGTAPPQGGIPFQGGSPWQGGGAKGGDRPGWNWGGYGYGEEDGGRGGRGGRGGDDDDEDERRAKLRALGSRQVAGATPLTPAPAPAAPAAPAVTARLIATWKAPQGVIPQRRRAAAGGRLQMRQSFNSTVPAASGCCANAVWFN